MFAKLPQRERDIVLAYCKGVNDTIDEIYAGALPEPIEVNILRTLGFGDDLFGNATNISDQVDPYYAPAAADPERPNAGFQFTPEMAHGDRRPRGAQLRLRRASTRTGALAELQALIAKHGDAAGTADLATT